jgi:elongation factor 1 alpha-like protein
MDEAEDYIYEYLVDEGWNPPARPVIRSTLKKVDGDVDAAIDELWARLEAKDPSLYGKPKKADKPSKEPKPKQAPKPQDPIKGKPFEKEVKEAQVVTSWDKARESVQKKKAELRGKELKRRALVESKIPISLVFAGHVDAGKSTLMGHLLVLAGKIGDRTMHKFDKESKEAGKHSFRYAWILDSGDSERFRGVTVDVGTQYFETERRSVTLLDAPGHKDFVPNMISGASQADYAVLVIDASPGEFERSFLDHAQTKEHALLLKSAGIDRIILLINKLDSVKWNQARYEEVSETVIGEPLHSQLLSYLNQII